MYTICIASQIIKFTYNFLYILFDIVFEKVSSIFIFTMKNINMCVCISNEMIVNQPHTIRNKFCILSLRPNFLQNFLLKYCLYFHFFRQHSPSCFQLTHSLCVGWLGARDRQREMRKHFNNVLHITEY